MTVERTLCRYVVVIGTGEFCGHPLASGNLPCIRKTCDDYRPLMYKPDVDVMHQINDAHPIKEPGMYKPEEVK